MQLWQRISIWNIKDYLRVNEKIPAHEKPANYWWEFHWREHIHGPWTFEKLLHFMSVRKIQIKTTKRYHFTTTRLGKWQSPASWSVSRGEEHGNSLLLVGGKTGTTTLRKFALTWYVWIHTHHTNFKYISRYVLWRIFYTYMKVSIWYYIFWPPHASISPPPPPPAPL